MTPLDCTKRPRGLGRCGRFLLCGWLAFHVAQAEPPVLELNADADPASVRAEIDRISRRLDREGLVAEQAVWGHLIRGRLHMHLRKYAQALADFQRAVELAPEEAMPYLYRGHGYAALHRVHRALDDYSRALQRDPDLVAAWYARGLMRERRHEYREAAADYQEALRRVPDHPGAKAALDLLGRKEMWWNPELVEALTAADALALDEAWDDALIAYEAILAKHADFIPAHLGKSMVLIRMQREREAFSIIDELVRRVPNHSEVQYRYGWLLEWGRDFDLALNAYALAVELNPGHARAATRRARLLWRNGDISAAMQSVSHAIDVEPDLSEARLIRAWLFYERAQFSAARQDLAYLDEATAGQPDARLLAAHLLLVAHRYEEAIKAYDSLIAENEHVAAAESHRQRAREALADPVLRDQEHPIEFPQLKQR